jgi:hypothetical protein
MFSSSFTISVLLPYGFTPGDDFVLQRVLNRDGMNKLSQLSISVSFTLWAICFLFVPVYVAHELCTVTRACLPYSSV